jgi:O-antigen/teichoic acid export membrane protein
LDGALPSAARRDRRRRGTTDAATVARPLSATAEIPASEADSADGAALVTRHIRGSSLMLVGRVMALGVGFLTQIIVVRHLAKSDYGAFAYALSAALLLQSVLALGADRTDTRFLAHYEHQRDHARLLGVIVFEAATVLVLGTAAVAAVWAFRAPLQGSSAGMSAGTGVFIALMALAPIQALDVMVVNVFAVFASPWSVFFRRYVLEPGFRFLVAVALVATGGGVAFLAVGYLAAGVAGVSLYLVLLVRLLRRRGFLPRQSLPHVTIPARELLAFSLPLLFTNLVAVAGTELAAVTLGHYRDAADVANFRAVVPFAALNVVVMISFSTLYTPAAARLQARGNTTALRALYWQSACWVAVLTFPVLCVMTALAPQVTVDAIGERYAGSAVYLALLAIGYYVNAAFGFNGITLQMLGRVRYVLVMNVVVLAWLIGANLLLVPRWGAMGATIAVLSTIVVHNVGKQAGLGFGSGIGIVDRRHAGILAAITVTAAVVNAALLIVHVPLLVGLFIVAVVTAVMVRVLGPTLDVRGTLPELARLPIVRWLLH